MANTLIKEAQETLLMAQAAVDVLTAEVAEAFPLPDDADGLTPEAEAAIDAYEDAYLEAGGYALEDARREAERILLAVCWDALSQMPGGSESWPAFEAAMGLGSPIGWVRARRKVLDLCLRMDANAMPAASMAA